MSLSTNLFRKVVGTFATGVTVITAQTKNGTPYGVTVNSFTSVSLDPLLVLICLDNQLSGLDTFVKGGHFAVNILAHDQKDISNHFASRGSDRSQGPYVVGETGIPVLSGSIAYLECSTIHCYPGGDHIVLIAKVKSAKLADPQKDPLLFFQGCYRRLASGKE